MPLPQELHSFQALGSNQGGHIRYSLVWRREEYVMRLNLSSNFAKYFVPAARNEREKFLSSRSSDACH